MKRIFFIALIAMVLFLSGCQSGTDGTTAEDSASFIGGTDALKFSFVDSAPSNEVIASTPFGMTLLIQNSGEASVAKANAVFEISGIIPSDFGKVSADMSKIPGTDLTEKKKTIDNQVTPGTETYLDFGTFNYASELAGNMPFTINAKACYAYYTSAVTKMCVRKDLLGATVNPGKGCSVKEDKVVQNSGAPVHITSLTETPSGKDRVSFTFTIEKVGAGDVYKFGGLIKCDESDNTMKNKVLFTIDTGIAGLTCDAVETPVTTTSSTKYSGYITLFSGKRTVTCTQIVPALDAEKVVNMRLDYLYSETVSKSITVKKI